MKRHRVFVVLLCAALVAVAACAVPGSYVQSSVNGMQKTYRYDEGGKKVLVYEIDPAGNITVHDPNDKRAQQMVSWDKGRQKAEAAQAVRLEKIRQAPKRKPNDPIFVNIEPVEYVDGRLKLTGKDKKEIQDSFRKSFENHPIIRIAEGRKKYDADVKVVLKVSYEAGLGGSKGTPIKEIQALGYVAAVTNRWLGDTHEAKGSASMYAISKHTKEFTEKVKYVILNDAGPNIPADRSL